MLTLLLVMASSDPNAAARAAMVAEQIEARGISDPEVLRAMRVVPRERFLPPETRHLAFEDGPAPIGLDQTISQPYVVAFMTDALDVAPGMRVLEVGTGSGYQAAVLAELGAHVYSIEILAPLAAHAAEALYVTGYKAVHLRVGDGYQGWPEAAPFDRIIVTAAPDHVPAPLLDQLAPGGRLILPVGDHRMQHLTVITRTPTGYDEQSLLPVLFVPMTGQAEQGAPPAP